MRLTLLFLVIAISQVLALEAYSQTARLNLKKQNSTIREVLMEIEEQSEFYFMYNGDVVDVDQKVSIEVENQLITDVLDKMFEENGIVYKVNDRQIALSVSSDTPLMQQEKTIKGQVKDSSGAPLPGVTIVVKGTTHGTISGEDGSYSLANVSPEAILVFSFVGMNREEVAVSGKTIIDMVMTEDAIGIEEVVAIGYGTMKKSDLTGSVTSVSSDELAAFPTLNVSQAIQGRAAGVQITQINGDPGARSRIRIRGGTSINASSDPLWVVDGFAGGYPPAPEDVESIEILKDASATSIYGSRGANGVILVTTKSGKIGETRIELNSSYSFDKTSKKLDLLNAADFGTFINEVRKNSGSPSVPFSDPNSLGEGTDWQDVIFRNGSIQNHQISASGGKENFRFYTSVNYFDQEGIIINSDFKRYSGLMNLDFDAGKNIKIGTKMNLRREIRNGVRSQGLWGGYQGVTTRALTFEPTQGIYKQDRTFTRSVIGDPKDNPYATATEFVDETVNDIVDASGYVDLTLMEGLVFKSTFGVSITNRRAGSYWPTTVIQGENVGGRADIRASKTTELSNENYFTYNKTINDNHKINLVAGMSVNTFRSEYWSSNTESYLTDNFSFWNLGGGAEYRPNYSNLTESGLLSYYGRANYNFKDKYLLTVTGRYDGSSRFGANKKWGFFPSGALAWNVKQEPFLESFEDLSHLKFRVSYGLVGNEDIGSYRSLANFESTTAIVNDDFVNAVVPESVANSDLSWESTKQTDIGIDMGFWDERLILTADYYYKKTDDLLYNVPLPDYSGYSSMLMNIGAVENKGFELGLNTVNVQGELNWTTDLNVSMNRNNVLSLPGGELKYAAISASFNMEPTSILTEGSPVGSFYGYVYEGVNPEDGSPMFKDVAGRDAEGNLVMEPDGTLNSDDRKIIGNPHPDLILGFTNTFQYKNFDLNVFFQGVIGGDIYNFTRMELEVANGMSNQLTSVLDRWTPENTDASIPRASNSNDYTSSTRWVEDATYFRLKNLSLGYNLPSSIIGKYGIQKARIYVSGQNLLTITDYKGYNPDVSYRNGNIRLGLDYGAYPTTRSITLGLNLSF